MKNTLVIRRVGVWAASSLGAVIAIVAGLSAALDAGYLRGPFIRFVSSQAGRPIEIGGILETHIWSLHPRITAARVTIRNPAWTPAGVAARLEKVTLVFHLPQGGDHSFGIQRLELDGARLTLIRDSKGRANWQTTDPGTGEQGGLPLIRSLSMRGAQVELSDELRHLHFKGMVAAEDVNQAKNPPPLQIAGRGELNGRTATFDITGEPLAGASHDRPYAFHFSERSSGSVLTGNGSLVQAFDFSAMDAKFEAAGEDLLDLYFLTGVKLVNTGSYHLSGEVAGRGTHTEFRNLAVKSGGSDVFAKVSIESAGSRPKFDAELNSQVIRTSDLGARAAGREDPDSGQFLLSNAMLNPRAVRHGDWRANFHARRVDVGHLSLQEVSAKMTIDRGILVVDPLSAGMLGGKVIAHLRLDAKTDDPNAEVDLKLTDVQLAQFGHKDAGPPPFEGSLQARANFTGRGRSIHEVAASANGPLTAVLTHGAIRTSLAELTGFDFRALGLMLAKSKQETGIRCLVGSFQARDGTLDAQRLIIDTDPVLITGEGRLHLDSESLDFTLQGHPKGLRLFRLRAPVLARGTLLHPAFSLRASDAVAETAKAVALGVALTPLAAVFAFVDPGLAKDADCASLREESTAAAR